MNILVTGGSLGDVPIIRFLKSQGYRVVTSGNRPKDVGHRFGDIYIPCNYTDVNGIEYLCRQEKISALIPSSHDLAAIAASKVAQKLGLPGYDKPEISMLIHNKDRLRKALASCGIPQPNFWLLQSEADLLDYKSWEFPVIVKPVDLTGGNGIEISQDLYSLRRAFERAQSVSRSGLVIVEEYLKGSFHGVTTIIHNQSVKFVFSDNEFFLFDSFRVSATTTPSDLNPSQIELVTQMISRFAKKLKLVDGLLHVQLILKEDKIYILEICRRTPGDLYPYFVEFATKKPYTKWIVSPFIGENYQENDEWAAAGQFTSTARFMLMSDRRGTFKGIVDEFQKQYELVFPALPIGSFIDHPKKDTLAIYFLCENMPFSKETIFSIKNQIRPKISADQDEIDN